MNYQAINVYQHSQKYATMQLYIYPKCMGLSLFKWQVDGQKIPYHMVFDVKYDLRHKERLVVGGNWMVNEKEDVYSEVV